MLLQHHSESTAEKQTELLFSLLFTESKKTWDGIRNVSEKKNSTPTKLIYKNQEKVSNIKMAESLNDFFLSILDLLWNLKSPNNFQSYLGIPNSKSIFLEACTSAKFLKIIENMKSTKASGPNSISTNLLIEFSQYVVYPLASIINKSLKEGSFPSLNKEADVCPIHKKNEYQPISLPSISKIVELVIRNHLQILIWVLQTVFHQSCTLNRFEPLLITICFHVVFSSTLKKHLTLSIIKFF